MQPSTEQGQKIEIRWDSRMFEDIPDKLEVGKNGEWHVVEGMNFNEFSSSEHTLHQPLVEEELFNEFLRIRGCSY